MVLFVAPAGYHARARQFAHFDILSASPRIGTFKMVRTIYDGRGLNSKCQEGSPNQQGAWNQTTVWGGIDLCVAKFVQQVGG